MDDLGGNTTIFGNAHIFPYLTNISSQEIFNEKRCQVNDSSQAAVPVQAWDIHWRSDDQMKDETYCVMYNWVVVFIHIFIFTPKIGEDFPIWLAHIFQLVGKKPPIWIANLNKKHSPDDFTAQLCQLSRLNHVQGNWTTCWNVARALQHMRQWWCWEKLCWWCVDVCCV